MFFVLFKGEVCVVPGEVLTGSEERDEQRQGKGAGPVHTEVSRDVLTSQCSPSVH